MKSIYKTWPTKISCTKRDTKNTSNLHSPSKIAHDTWMYSLQPLRQLLPQQLLHLITLPAGDKRRNPARLNVRNTHTKQTLMTSPHWQHRHLSHHPLSSHPRPTKERNGRRTKKKCRELELTAQHDNHPDTRHEFPPPQSHREPPS